jgi:hypothetical protein
MNTQEQERKITLDHMIDEKFGEIFFIAKEEFDIGAKSTEEQKLWEMLERFKGLLKRKCKYHFQNDDEDNELKT